ncbi:MAG: hypothetical protein PHI11_02670 [Gallionella sp.]|nr:hypothetical protein [Gallionella sp.]
MGEPKRCWICGEIATSGEHLLKRTDVVAVFGESFSKRVVKADLEGNHKKYIQSPNSKYLKYPVNLCANCNNARTQPYDRAYKQFADYIRENFDELKHGAEINTNLVFGKQYAKKMQRNLFCYFAKSFGCQLDDVGLPVPKILKSILNGENYGNLYRVGVCIRPQKLDGLSNFPLEGDQDEYGKPVDFYWAQDNGSFTVIHAYNRQIPAEYGDEWLGKSKRIVMGKWSDI